MIDFTRAYKNKIINELIENKLEIHFLDGTATITEANIASESMKLTQSICDSSQLRFGGGIASEFSIDLLNSIDRSFDSSLTGKWISVRLTQSFPSGTLLYPSASLFPGATVFPGETISSQTWYLFSGYIDSVKTDKNDRNKRTIVAYDLMAKLHEWDVTNTIYTEWMAGLTTGMSIEYLITYLLGTNCEVPGFDAIPHADSNYLNETMMVSGSAVAIRTLDILNRTWLDGNDKLTCAQLMQYIGEMCGLFCVIKPNATYGELKWIALGTGAYDLNAGGTSVQTETYQFHEKLYYEDYDAGGYTHTAVTVGGIDREEKISLIELSGVPDGIADKVYDATDNTLAWQNVDNSGGGWVHKLQEFYSSNGVSGRYYQSSYRPCEAELDGRLWVECGDKIAIKYHLTDVYGDYILDDNDEPIIETINSYVLSRTLSGIKCITDTITVKGE